MLKASKKAWALASCLCLGFILKPASAHAESSRQQLVYEVYAGGIHALQATMDVDLRDKSKYSLVLYAKTRGMLGALAPWHGTFESHGWKSKGDFAPQKHQSTATWRGETDIKEYLYNKDGTFQSLKITEGEKAPENKDVEAEVTDGTIDVLTATLRVMENYNEAGRCEGKAEVFDGKRRFEQRFKHKQEVTLTPSKYNIYGGKAAECTVEVTPINGEWSKKPRGWLSIQEQGRDKGTMPTVWMGRVTEDGPAVPVKIRVKTDYGTLFMHLAEYNSAETSLVAEKRVTE